MDGLLTNELWNFTLNGRHWKVRDDWWYLPPITHFNFSSVIPSTYLRSVWNFWLILILKYFLGQDHYAPFMKRYCMSVKKYVWSSMLDKWMFRSMYKWMFRSMSDHLCLINEKTSVEIDKAMFVHLTLTKKRDIKFSTSILDLKTGVLIRIKDKSKIHVFELYINVQFQKRHIQRQKCQQDLRYVYLLRDFDSELYISRQK